MKRFPNDIIIGHGGIIFNLVKYLYGTLDEMDERVSHEGIIKKSDKVKVERENYLILIRFVQ
jgi:hypothetical protein